MTRSTFLLTTGILFALIAVGHVLRILFGVTVVVAGNSVPMWPSVVAAVVTIYLAYEAFRHRANTSAL